MISRFIKTIWISIVLAVLFMAPAYAADQNASSGGNGTNKAFMANGAKDKGGKHPPDISSEPPTPEMLREVEEINQHIRNKGAKWKAGVTSMTRLSPEERRKRGGGLFLSREEREHLKRLVPELSLGEEDTSQLFSSLSSSETTSSFSSAPTETSSSSSTVQTSLAELAATLTLPANLDYRNYNGGNYVTSVKAQDCSNCWAYAATATLESRALLDLNMPDVDLDLSEKITTSCSGSGDCSGGWQVTDFFVNTGLPPESYFPGSVWNGCSSATVGWQLDTYKVSGYTQFNFSSVDEVKAALNTNGPLYIQAAFWYEFYSYISGVYSWSGTPQYYFYHAVELVGYDDDNSCFIVKNSWGPGWGEQGYFRIAYSEFPMFGHFAVAYTGAYHDEKTGVMSAITNPSSNITIKSTRYSVSGKAAARGTTVREVYVSMDGGATWNLSVDTSGNGSWTTWNYDCNFPSEGNYTIRSKAVDADGVEENPAAGFRITVDNTAPMILYVQCADAARQIYLGFLDGLVIDGRGAFCYGLMQENTPDWPYSWLITEMSQDGGQWATIHNEHYLGNGPGYYQFYFDLTSTVVGSHQAKFRATDQVGNVSSEYVANFSMSWPTSTITSPVNGVTIREASVLITGTVIDNFGNGMQKIEVSTDGGATWNLATGTETWSYNWVVPGINGATYHFLSRAIDNAGHVELPGAGVTVRVTYDPLVVITSNVLNGTTGMEYNQVLTASGGFTPYTWSVASGSLPVGLSLNSASGLISGAPTTLGTFNFTVQVSDGYTSDTQELSVIISELLVVETNSLAAGMPGEVYNQTLSATGGLQPYTWSIASEILPPGLNLNTATGEIGGTPSQNGIYSFTVAVTDANGTSASSGPLSITIDGVGIATSQLVPGTVGSTYNQTLAVIGGVAPYAWAITSGSLTPGLTLNSATGEISGVPTAVGMYEVTFQVTDASQNTKTKTLVMSINDIALQWARLYDGGQNDYTSRKIAVDASGNSYVAGYSNNGANNDYLTMKYSPSGDLLWMQRYDTGFDEYPQYMTLDAAGNAYVTGYSYNGTILVALTVKYDSGGNLLWSQTHSNGYYEIGTGIAADSAGNAYITGYSHNGTNGDFIAVKYDSAGNVVWSQSYDNGYDDYAQMIAIDGSGNTYVTGYSTNGTNYDIVTIKYAASGEVVWTQRNDSGFDEFATASHVDSAGNVYITGQVFNGTTYEILTVKYDSAGALVWSRRHSDVQEYPAGITVDASGNSYVVGYSYDGTNWAVLTIKYDAAGNEAWSRRYVTSDEIASIAVDGNGNPHVATIVHNGTNWDILLIKYDQAGNMVWTQIYDSGSEDYLGGMTLDARDNVYLNGSAWNGANQDFLTIKYFKVGQGIAILPNTLSDPGYNISYRETLQAMGGIEPYTWSIAAGALPAGLVLNSATGEISGIPTADYGVYTFTIRVADAANATAEQAYTISVLDLPYIVTPGLPSSVMYESYSQALVAQGGSTPYTWGINSGSLPSGLELNPSNGWISGSAWEAGTFTFTVEVNDANGLTAYQEFTIDVAAIGIGTKQLDAGVVGQAYYQALAVQAGSWPFDWSITSGSLPPGLGLNTETGEISGTPAQAGLYPFTVIVVDGVGASASAALLIAIDQVGIATTQLAPGTVGTSYRQALTAIGGTAPFTWTVTSGSLPAGLTLNSATGEISGEPTTVGMNEVTFQVTDANQYAKTKTLVLSINDILLQWARTYDGGDNDYIARKTTVDASGNTYVTGYSYNGSTYDSVTVKYSPSGDALWMQRADNGYDEYPQSIALDPAGNVYVTGYYYNGAIQAALTIKYDSEGNMLWRRTYSNGSYDIAESIAIDAGGNAYITGQSYNGVNYDIVAIKYDASGNQVWSRTYNNEFGAYAELIAVDSSGNPYVTGYANSGTGEDIVTIKYTTAGEIVWTQINDSGIYEYPYDIKLDADGSAYITGRSYNGTDYDVLTLKYASDGGLLWSRTYDNGYQDYPEGIALDGAGNCYVAAFTYNGTAWEALTIKYDSAGNTAWFRRYELTRRDRIRVAVDGSGNPHVVTGSNNGTDDDILILKYDAAGNLIWTQLYDSGSDDRFQSMALDGQGNVYLNGRSWNETNQDYLTVKYYKVGQGILITPAALPNAGYNIDYRQSLTALGGMAPYAWSISSGSLPDGLTLNAQTGEISGTATTLHAVHTFTAMATDALGATAGQAYSITVVDMPVITNAGLPSGVMYTAYNQLLNVSGGSAPYTWSISSGILPAGMTLNGATGRISGWPNEAGTFTVTVQVIDANGLTAVKDFTVAIANMAIGITQLASGIVGTPYYQALWLLGNPYHPCTWSISSGSLPPGITLNSETAEMSGTPSQAGDYAFTVTVIDSNGTSASASLSITIDDIVIATTQFVPGTVGLVYSQTLAATGGSAPYTWAVASGTLPAGLLLNSSTGEIGGVPSAVGMRQVTFQVTDGNQSTISKTLVMSINDILLQWAEKYDGGLADYVSGKVRVDALGNSYVTGQSYNGTSVDYLTIKYSPSGDVLWTQRADTGFDEYPQSIAIDPAGNVYVTGYSSNGTTNGALTIKYDSAGNMLWSQTHGNGIYEQVGTGIAVDSAGNAYITGYSYNGAYYSILAVKYDPAGNMLWSQAQSNGIEQFPSDIAADNAGNAYITGYAYNGANSDIVTTKFTAAGDAAWTRIKDSGLDESPNRIAADLAGNVYVLGNLDNGWDGDIVTLKYDSAGELIWSKTRDSGFDDGPVDIAVDDSGAAYITGNSHNGTNWDTWTAKYDSAGNMTWQHQYDGGRDEYASGIVIDGSGNAYVLAPFHNGTNQDLLIIKYDPNGAMVWTQIYDSGSDDYLDSMALDAQGNLFLKGNFYNGMIQDYLTVKYYKVGQGIAIMPAGLSNPGYNITYRETLRALGGMEPYTWGIVNGALPDGLTLNAATGEISGTATSNHAAHTFTAKATDSLGATAEQVYTLTVADAPVILTEALPDAVIWIEYRTTLAATGGSGAYEWSITAGRLPGGLILNRTTGEISGMAWELGTYPVTITLTDINSNVVICRDFNLSVDMIGIANSTLAKGRVGVQYSDTLTALGGTPPYTWSISGALPDGLNLDSSTGEIAGIPLIDGENAITLQVTDSQGAVASKLLSIAVDPAAPLGIVTSWLPAGLSGAPYSITLTASGGVSPYTWTQPQNMPPGLVLNVTTGEISGRPTTAGNYEIVVQVQDYLAQTTAKTLIVHVYESGVYELDLKVFDQGADERPAGLSIDSPGNIFIGGTRASDFLFLKYGADGSDWARVYDGGGNEYAAGSAVDSLGNLYVTGDLLTVKYDVNGVFQWAITNTVSATSIAVDHANNIYVAGVWNNDYVVVRYDTTGIQTGGPFIFDTGAADYAYGVAVDDAGYIYLTGISYLSEKQLNTVKFNPSGGIEWSVAYTGGYGAEDISVDAAGNVYVAGSKNNTVNGAQDRDTLLIKYDSAGNQIWDRTFSQSPSYDRANAVTVDASGNIYIAGLSANFGYTGFDCIFAKYDPQGNVVWNATVDQGNKYCEDIAIGPDGAVSVTGVSESTDIFFAKYKQVDRLTIVTESVPFGTTGTDYSAVLSAQGGTSPYSWTIAAGSSLPAGLSLSGSGTISGTPAGTGSFTFDIEATDARGAIASKALSMTVYAPLLIATSSLPNGSAGTPYSQYLSASGGQEPYHWTITDGNLPEGLTLSNSSGLISETPILPGVYNFTVQVTDANGTAATEQFWITIYAQLVISTSSLPNAVVDMQYSDTLTGLDGLPPYTWSIIAGALPDGLILDNSTGAITGVPPVTGVFTFTVQVTDSQEAVASKSFTITIHPPMPDLVVTMAAGPETAQPGQSVTVANTVRNQGVANAVSSTVCIYLSSDSTISRSDILLATKHLCNGLEAGVESTSDIANFAIPEIANGTYYIGALADCTGEVTEIDEANNSIAGNQITISQ